MYQMRADVVVSVFTLALMKRDRKSTALIGYRMSIGVKESPYFLKIFFRRRIRRMRRTEG